MSNWALSAATRIETLGAGTGDGTSVASSTANTKGAYTTIGTTSFPWLGFFIHGMGTSATRYRIDIATNNGGSDQIVVQDFYIDQTTTDRVFLVANLPISIPSGAVVKARCQSTAGGSVPVRMVLTGYAGDFPLPRNGSRVLPLNAWTSTDPTSFALTGTTLTAWQEVTASTAAAFSALWITPGGAGDGARSAARMVIDVGVGGAGSEVVVARAFSAQATSLLQSAPIGPLPVRVPAASRVAVRVQCSAATTDSIGIAVHGLVS